MGSASVQLGQVARCTLAALALLISAHCGAEGSTTSSGRDPSPLSNGTNADATGGAGDSTSSGDSGVGADDACSDATVQAVVALTNDERDKQGLAPLTCHALASDVARTHSIDMCDHNTLSHDSSDGTHFDDRLKDAGIMFSAAGENVAQGATTPAEVIAMWMASSGHRANILSTEFTDIGVGYAACSGAHYWTQVFFK